MSDSITTDQKPRFPLLPFAACVATSAVGLALLLMLDSGNSDMPNTDEPLDITSAEAARIRAVAEDADSQPPFTMTNRGEVIEVSAGRIVLNDGGQKMEWPLASDAQVWKNQKAINVNDLQPGDTVEIDFQQRGSRSEGWKNTAININVESDERFEATASQQLAMPATEVTGFVVEADSGVIAIEDSDGLRSTYPLKSTALVFDGAETIPVDELSVGEHVTLTTSKSGSRTDGWIVTVTQIERNP